MRPWKIFRTSRKLTKSDKSYIYSRSASIIISSNHIKLCTMCFCDSRTCKSFSSRIFWSHAVYIRVVFIKSNGACVKVYVWNLFCCCSWLRNKTVESVIFLKLTFTNYNSINTFRILRRSAKHSRCNSCGQPR